MHPVHIAEVHCGAVARLASRFLRTGGNREPVRLARGELRLTLMFPNQHQITNIDYGGKKKAKDQGYLPNINGVDQHHHAAGDAQIPKLNRNDAALQSFGNVPLNDEAAGKEKIRDQPEDRPEGDLAGEILPQIVQVMRQRLFFAPGV